MGMFPVSAVVKDVWKLNVLIATKISLFFKLPKIRNFAFEKNGSEYRLSHKHPYCYKVQTELNVCEKDYCDFYVCGQKKITTLNVFILMLNSGLHVSKSPPSSSDCASFLSLWVNSTHEMHQLLSQSQLVMYRK